MSKSKRARSRCAPKPRSNPALARALLLTVGRERIRSRRVLRLLCRPNGATVATIMESTGCGSRTRCGGPLPAGCARGSGQACPRRRAIAAVSTGSVAVMTLSLR